MRKMLGVLKGRELYLTIKQQALTRFPSDLENRKPRKEFSYPPAVFSCVMSDYKDNPGCTGKDRVKATGCRTGNSCQAWRKKTSPQQGWLDRERDCPERLSDLHPWRHRKLSWTQPWGIWSHFKFSSAQGREVRPNHLLQWSGVEHSHPVCTPECQVTLLLTRHWEQPQEPKAVIKQIQLILPLTQHRQNGDSGVCSHSCHNSPK